MLGVLIVNLRADSVGIGVVFVVKMQCAFVILTPYPWKLSRWPNIGNDGSLSLLNTVGTIALWVTYAFKKKELDSMEVGMDAADRNVTTFLIFAILATIFTVRFTTFLKSTQESI